MISKLFTCLWVVLAGSCGIQFVTGAEPKSAGPAGDTVTQQCREALKPLRAKVAETRSAVDAAVKQARERQKRELSSSVCAENRLAVARANAYLAGVQGLVAKLGQVSASRSGTKILVGVSEGASAELDMPDGTKQIVSVSVQNASAVLAQARMTLLAAQTRAAHDMKKCQAAQREELKKYTALYPPIDRAKQTLRAAEAVIAPVVDDHAQVAIELAKCEPQIDKLLQGVHHDLEQLTSQGRAQ